MNRFEYVSKHYIEDNSENCCARPDIAISNEGIRVCRNCGMTFGQEMVSHERRAYSVEEIQARKRTEPRWRCFGPRTVIAKVKADARGRQLPAKNQALYARLSKIQASLINSIERNFWEAKPKLQSLGSKFLIPDYVKETAWTIYKEIAKQKLTMGRSIEGFVLAALYTSIRIHNFPRLLEELIDGSQPDRHMILRSLGLIVRNVLPVLNLKYRPIRPEPLVYRFGNDLNLNIAVQQAAAKILHTTQQRGLKIVGKDPKGLAAAALYIAAKQSKVKMTQTQIASAARVTEVTLRTRAKQIKEFLNGKNQITTPTRGSIST